MLLRFTTMTNWKVDSWDRAFNLINELKREYSLKINSMGTSRDNRYYFSVGGYDIHFESNGRGFWITVETNESKDDFDDKFNFIYKRI